VKAAPPAASAPITTTTRTIFLEIRCIGILLDSPHSFVAMGGF
jgi:hypothetical protein